MTIPDPTRDLPDVALGSMLENVLREVKEWQNQVSDGFAALNSDTEYSLRMRTRALLAEYEAIINSTDPGPLGHADASLRERLLVEAQQAYWELFKDACMIAERVAETLGGTKPHTFAGLPVVAPEQLVAGLAPPRPPRTGTPVAARVLKVFRPGWSGIMMTLILTKLLEVPVSGLVLTGLAVFGAVLMGGAAYTGERKRQLDRRRVDAVSAVRGTIEDFRLTLNKQLRDASRALQRDLRRVSAATAAERVSDLSAELKVAKGTRLY